MRRLIAAAEAYTGSSSSSKSGAVEQQADKRPRVEVLESSAQSMELLLHMVGALRQRCEEQQRALDAVEANERQHVTANEQRLSRQSDACAAASAAGGSKRLRLLGSALSRTLDASVSHMALQASSFALSLGRALDANDGCCL